MINHWRVFVFLPMDQSSSDSVSADDLSFTIVCILASLGFIGCATLFVQFYCKRTEKGVVCCHL
jgi:hypothetical protein